LLLHVVTLTYACQHSVSEIPPPPRGLTAVVIVIVTAQIQRGVELDSLPHMLTFEPPNPSHQKYGTKLKVHGSFGRGAQEYQGLVRLLSGLHGFLT